MPTRRKKQIDPLELKRRRLRRPRAARRRSLRRDDAARRCRARRASTSSSSTAPPSVGSPADRLYVPTDQLDQVTRYVGGEQPSLDRLGGADWSKRKSRARKAVRQIAGRADQAVRRAAGHPRPRLRPRHPVAARARGRVPVRGDARPARRRSTRSSATWSGTVPMDRLICGDVGYGKTEIAVRAAFKAVQDGKQVAVLVPTTLLVQQHFTTFTERMAEFPVHHQAPVALPDRQGGRGGHRAARRRHRRHRHRHPPAAQPGHPDQGPRPDHRRRGAALRRRAQGAAEDGCAPRSTCCRCPRRRSRAPWRWRSPASGRCPPSPPRRRSGTRC